MMMCSFQLPEPRQPSYQYPMPPDVPAPEACEGIEVIYEKLLRDTTDEKVKGFCRTMLEVRSSIPKYYLTDFLMAKTCISLQRQLICGGK